MEAAIQPHKRTDFVSTMEVLLRRGGCVCCNAEAITPPQPLHKHGQHGGGRPLAKRLTFFEFFFFFFFFFL